MPFIALCGGPFCGAGEVAARVAKQLGYVLLRDELLQEAAVRAGLSAERLQNALTGSPAFFDSLTHERERARVYTEAELARQLQRDSVVYEGPALHLIPRGISHVLRVCLLADQGFRIARAEARGLSRRQAAQQIERGDTGLGRLTHELFRRAAWDPTLYDMRIPVHTTGLERAVEMICEAAARPALGLTEESVLATCGFLLASRVRLALLLAGQHDCAVEAEEGRVTVVINRQVLRLQPLEEELARIARSVEGVELVSTKVGPAFNQPDIYRRFNFETPRKVLLVDDEREYVMTLSERLQLRDVDADVAHDGAEALAYLGQTEPSVMVLDLRMPGIDGLEVLRRVKRDHPRVQVIILTGHGNERDQQMALELGAFAYLQKPVDIGVLARTIAQAKGEAGPAAEEPETEVEE